MQITDTGGFASILKKQGKKMATKKTTNFDSCRDLAGRRLKAVQEAKELAEYLEKEPERQKAAKEKADKIMFEFLNLVKTA